MVRGCGRARGPSLLMAQEQDGWDRACLLAASASALPLPACCCCSMDTANRLARAALQSGGGTAASQFP